jgi:HSP20 family molecular chaperone IbpA
MATMMVEPFTPWLRELSQVLHDQGTVRAFFPPADRLIDDDGVTVYMDVPGLRSEDIPDRARERRAHRQRRAAVPVRPRGWKRAARRIERGFGKFQRSVRVPGGLDPDAIEASLSEVC